MARSTNNLSLSTTKIVVSDDELVDPPLKPRAIRRKASLFAERRRREQWLTILGGDSVIEQIEERNTPEVAKARIARKKSRALHRQVNDSGAKESKARWKAKANRAAADWDDADHVREIAYELDEAEHINVQLGLRNPQPLSIEPDGHRAPSFRLAWVEYPGKPSKAQIRRMPRKCKDQFCGCRGYTPLGAAVTR